MPGRVGGDLLLAREEVREYIRRLAWLLDNFQVGAFVDEFADGGRYRLIPRENHERGHPVCVIDDSRKRLRYRQRLIEQHWHYEKFRELRMLSPVSVELDGPGGPAKAITNFVVYRTGADGITALHLAGVFEDELLRLEGRWRISSRYAILDTVLPANAVVLPP